MNNTEWKFKLVFNEHWLHTKFSVLWYETDVIFALHKILRTSMQTILFTLNCSIHGQSLFPIIWNNMKTKSGLNQWL